MKLYSLIKVEDRCIRNFRVYSYLYRFSKGLSLYLFNRTKILFGVDIAPTAIIGSNFKIVHIGGIVIGGESVIGNNVTIQNCVTLGMKDSTSRAMPIVHDNVYIGTGAKILGNVTIGKGAIIGANAVVTKSVPDYSIVAGIPAKVIRTYKP